MTDDWTAPARRTLLGLRGGADGWGYRADGPPSAEPTALAGLALLAGRGEGDDSAPRAAVAEAAARLAARQRADGSIGLTPDQPTPGWATPYVLLLWEALGTRADAARRAARWLLRTAGRPLFPRDDPDHVIGHDATLIGWPWVADTHSWLEPTAVALLALRRAGLGAHPRAREGLRLIRDRALAAGGWNYGNKSAFGRELRPQPGPTGLALLALASNGPAEPRPNRALDYLGATLPGVRAPLSLGWGLLGLRAWGRWPDGADRWLAESAADTLDRPDAAPRLALLLLASRAASLPLLGVPANGDPDV